MLDGFPRTVKQAESLDGVLGKIGKKLDTVLYFKTSPEVSIKRLSGRRACTKCGTNFHIKNMPPKKEGICDSCGAELVQRKDDAEDTVKKRLVVYEEETRPLIDYYKGRSILKEIPGDFEVSRLFEEIKELFVKEKLI